MKLSLDKTWEECLRMWKWIAYGKHKIQSSNRLRQEWLRDNGYDGDILSNDCFFCEYIKKYVKCWCGENMLHCPAEKIDKNFDCVCDEYSYLSHPRKFYKKLKELNKIRLARKKS